MSRVIVKQLPSKVSEKRLRELFSQCGEVTDIRLMKTRSGKFRNFGFVGFVSDSQAKAAVNHFNNTFIDASKILVEVAKPYGDETLDRPWSQYSKGSSAYLKKEVKRREKEKERGSTSGEQMKKEQTPKKEPNKSKLTKLLGEFYEVESEPQFQEFLATHQHKSKVHTWANDGTTEEKTSKKKEKTKLKRKPVHTSTEEKLDLTHEGDDTMSDPTTVEEDGIALDPATVEEDGIALDPATVEGDGTTLDLATAKDTSDMDYLRAKMVKQLPTADHEEKSEDESDSSSSDTEEETSDMDDVDTSKEEGSTMAVTPYTIKMRGLPFNATEEDVHTFFHPIKVVAIRFTSDNQGRPSGRAYVDFEREADLKNALKRNRDCIGRRYIELFKDEGPQSTKASKVEIPAPKPWELKNSSVPQDEGIAETGRLFIRNLPYTTTEEHLTELFEKFGPLTEAIIPLDSTTNKSTGIGFVTFMLPEHAVKAFNALDGQIFQGRLLHLLPAKSRQELAGREKGNSSSFKKKKDEKLKSESGSSHNWNTLFLGANAVMDAMAERYSTEKSTILDPESGRSAAVRMALGETQLVSETRKFLVSHGVKLDLFEQTKSKRSKTVILVKNLPFGTTEAELRKLFSPFGGLNQVILPPSGISALVEFLETSSAKPAFNKLAYTKFKHLPLYLEWAPLGVLDGTVAKKPTDEESKKTEEKDFEEVGEQSTVFVKNLNFSTNEDTLRDHFSRVGDIRSVSVARKRNMKDPAHPLSMGFGFIDFSSHKSAEKTIKELQNSELDGHKLELKLSHRETHSQGQQKKNKKALMEQKSAKILVRNIPFEASKREVKDLFRTFGELKTVRLPKKFSAQGEHRGFGFVEFLTKEDAKRAFEALCASTHLYGRRLVLEWADEGESVEAIRKRTAEHFHGIHVPSSKRKKVEELLFTLDNTSTQNED